MDSSGAAHIGSLAPRTAPRKGGRAAPVAPDALAVAAAVGGSRHPLSRRQCRSVIPPRRTRKVGHHVDSLADAG
jgi:hypothetical protein